MALDDAVLPLHRVLRLAAFPDLDHDLDGGAVPGNPAGVVLDAGDLGDAERLSIAAAVDYSETAFVEQLDDDRFVVRFWSPQAAVAFCGHATVAAAVALAELRGPGLVHFDTLAGEVPVRTDVVDGRLVATLTSVVTRTRPLEHDELDALLAALRWSHDDLDDRYPPHVAYAGNDHPVLAVHDRERLAALDYDYTALAALMAARGWTTAHLVHAVTPTLFHARDAFPPGGVVEDPATGSAAAAFGGYLRALGLVDPPARVTILQGHDLRRPCRLVVDVPADDDHVRVSGTAVPLPS